ncbi:MULTISPECIES: hypothetical protein [Marinobacter]|nr:hypothetical protein [Marinobacter sp.]
MADSMEMGEMPDPEGSLLDDINGKPVGKAFFYPEPRDSIRAVK